MDIPEKNYFEKKDEIDLKELLWIIKRHYISIIVIITLFMIGAIFYILLKEPIYSSSTTLLIEKPAENWWENITALGSQNRSKSEIYIIKSRTIAEKVVRDLRLNIRIIVPHREYEVVWLKLPHSTSYNSRELKFKVISSSGKYVIQGNGNIKFEGLLNKPVTSPSGGAFIKAKFFKKGDSGTIEILPFRKAVKRLMKNTSASFVEEKTRIIKITVEDPDPVIAARIANKIAEKYIEWKITARTEEATKSLEFINSQLKIIMKQLEDLEDKYDNIKKEKKILSIDKEIEAYIDQLSQMEATLYQIKFQKRAYIATLKALEKGKKTIYYPFIGDDEVLGDLIQQILTLKNKLAAAETEFTETSPEITTLKQQISESSKEIINYIRSRISDLSIQEKQMQITLNTLLTKLKTFPESEREILRLKRKLSVTEEIYKFLLEKKEEARITKAMTVSKIRIIDPAIPPTAPVSPNKKLILILTFTFGILAALLLVILYDYINDTIKSIDELKHIINLPIFGIIPKIYPSDEEKKGKFDPYLIVHYNPRSQVSEAYRMLRTNIQFIDPTGSTKVFLITSALPQEGKSITNANLAITLSRLGSKTLILDLDLHKPRQHEIFRKPLSPGLTDYLTSHRGISLEDIIKKLDFDNLYLIPAGTIPPNPSELISSQPFRNFLARIRDQFDFILIDSPPVTAVTDTLILSTIVDAVLLVVVEGSSGRENIKRAVELLNNVGGKLKGTIFNNVSPAEKKYGYYYASYYTGEELSPPLIQKLRKKFREFRKRLRKK